MVTDNRYCNTKSTRRAMYFHFQGCKACLPEIKIARILEIYQDMYGLQFNENENLSQRSSYTKLSREFKESFPELKLIIDEDDLEGVILRQHLRNDFYFYKAAIDYLFPNDDNSEIAKKKFVRIFDLDLSYTELL